MRWLPSPCLVGHASLPAPASGPGDQPGRGGRPCRGFTLLELMVVLVLIGIISTFAVLSVGRHDQAAAMERETRRLATLIDMANNEAVIRGEELAIHFTVTGYSFMVLQADGWRELQDDDLLKPYTLPRGISVRIEVEGDPPGLGKQGKGPEQQDKMSEDKLTPQVYILSSGEMTPFSATFEVDQSPVRYHLTATMLGKLDWEAEKTF